jgi:hypothetical protein
LTYAVALASPTAADRSGDQDRTVPRYRFRGIASVLLDRVGGEQVACSTSCAARPL